MADNGIRIDTATALWQDLLREGEHRVGARLGEDVQAYLVFLLMRHLRDGALAGRTMALDWLGAWEHAGRVRADALRDVGDRCLLLAGWYPRLAERRRVSRDYFATLGRSAYDGVAEARQDGYGELFARLAQAYQAMIGVLAATVAVANGTMPASGPTGSCLAPGSLRRH